MRTLNAATHGNSWDQPELFDPALIVITARCGLDGPLSSAWYEVTVAHGVREDARTWVHVADLSFDQVIVAMTAQLELDFRQAMNDLSPF